MMARVLAVLAAVMLVGAFALATLPASDMSLGDAALLVDDRLLDFAQAGIEQHLAPWMWQRIMVPLLMRPVWMVPAALGLLLAGGAATLANSRAHRSHRRRS